MHHRSPLLPPYHHLFKIMFVVADWTLKIKYVCRIYHHRLLSLPSLLLLHHHHHQPLINHLHLNYSSSSSTNVAQRVFEVSET